MANDERAKRRLEDAEGDVHYYFPVEIEVRSALDPKAVKAAVDEALRHLAGKIKNGGPR